MRNPGRHQATRVALSLAWLASISWTAAVGAQRAVPDLSLVGGTLAFLGHSTVGDFTGTTTAVTGRASGDTDLAGVRGWVEAPVNTLRTGNDHRDRDLRSSLEAATYPSIRFELTAVTDVSAMTADSLSATLRGTLAIHGVTRDVALPATLLLAGDSIRVRSAFPLNLNDYRVRGLTKMLGILRMHPDIEVRVDLRFARATPGVSAENGTGRD